MRVTMYIYAPKLPSDHLTLYRCINCGRSLFKANSEKLMITNAYGAGIKDLPPSSNFIEYHCHSCKALYAIYFQ